MLSPSSSHGPLSQQGPAQRSAAKIIETPQPTKMCTQHDYTEIQIQTHTQSRTGPSQQTTLTHPQGLSTVNKTSYLQTTSFALQNKTLTPPQTLQETQVKDSTCQVTRQTTSTTSSS